MAAFTLSAEAADSKATVKQKGECETTEHTQSSSDAVRRPTSTPATKDTTTTGAAPDSASSANDPNKTVREIVANAKPSEGGQMVAETGRARPVESWFGCPPK